MSPVHSGSASRSSTPAARAVAFARRLGPESTQLIAACIDDGRLTERLRRHSIEDAVLGLVHESMGPGTDLAKALGTEFATHLTPRIRAMVLKRLTGCSGGPAVSDQLSEALTHMWKEREGFRFGTLNSYLSYVSQGIEWRIQTYFRAESAPCRDAQRRVRGQTDCFADPARSPLTQVEQQDTLDRLALSIQRLPERQRKIIDLRLQGMRAPAIAEALQMKTPTVRATLKRAMQRLGYAV